MGAFKARLADGRAVYVDGSPDDQGNYDGELKHSEQPVRIRWDAALAQWIEVTDEGGDT